MKKLIVAGACMALSMLAAVQAQHRADRQALVNGDSFSMILLGDPQGYVKYDINQPLFELQTAWIADNVVPYIISTGNHDYGYRHAENGMTRFPEYFPIERNRTWFDCAVAVFPNRNGVESLENAAFEFDDPNWGKLLVVCNEFAPRDEVLDWTRALISGDRFRNHRVVYITHSLIGEDKAERTDNEPYGITPRNWGRQVWEKLIEPSENIVLALCGHMGELGGFENSVGYRVDPNAAGKPVSQMMFNVQTLGGGWEGNGGDGWLRILEFLPDGVTVKVRTYSPLFGISPSTRHLAHRRGDIDEFEMKLAR